MNRPLLRSASKRRRSVSPPPEEAPLPPRPSRPPPLDDPPLLTRDELRHEINNIVARTWREATREYRLNLLYWTSAVALLLIAWAIKESCMRPRYAYYANSL